MKYSDCIRMRESNFENRLLYAQLISPYDNYVDAKYGYLAGAEECLESNKSIEELEEHIQEFESSQSSFDEYDRAYVQAYVDYVNQEKKESVTNE